MIDVIEIFAPFLVSLTLDVRETPTVRDKGGSVSGVQKVGEGPRNASVILFGELMSER